MGPWFVLFGSFAVYTGIRTWPHPGIEDGQRGLSIASIFFGVLFGGLGLWATIHQIFWCGFPLPNLRALVGFLELKSWPPVIPFTLFIAVISGAKHRKAGIGWCLTYAVFGAAFGFAAAEAAAFHVGIQAERWFVLAMLIIAFLGGLEFLRKGAAGNR